MYRPSDIRSAPWSGLESCQTGHWAGQSSEVLRPVGSGPAHPVHDYEQFGAVSQRSDSVVSVSADPFAGE
jgi:hypothetical protein